MMKKLLFGIAAFAIFSTLFLTSILNGHILIASIVWLMSGLTSFVFDFWPTFRKWNVASTGSMMVYAVFGLFGFVGTIIMLSADRKARYR